jgi:hypothetical protein
LLMFLLTLFSGFWPGLETVAGELTGSLEFQIYSCQSVS